MKVLVRPELPTASVGSSQATTAAVDNSAPLLNRLEPTYKSGKTVQTNGATSEEIARITARIVASAIGFRRGEIKRDQEYICSEYVYECYKQIGIDVPYDKRGFVAPADFAKDKNVDLLWELKVKSDSSGG